MGPDDIELGEEPIHVERRPRSGVVISARLSSDEADRLQAVAALRGVTLSQIAREAITTFLSGGLVDSTSTGPWTGTVSGNGHFELFTVGRRLPVRTEARGPQPVVGASAR
jgi:hypothetical protein